MKVDAKLISSVPNIIYLTNFSNFSETEREAFILLTEKKKYIITDKRYSEAIKKKIKEFEIIDEGAFNFISSSIKEFFKKNNIKKLGIEEDNLTVTEYKKINKYIKTYAINYSLNRIIKNEEEIENIKKACSIGDQAFEFIINKLKVGVTEKQISDELEAYIKSKKANPSFKPIIAFGMHSSSPHHETSYTKLSKNQIVLMDFGVKINNYCSDMTRTVFFGKADEKFKKIYNTVLQSQEKAIKSIYLNQKASMIDKTARDYIIKNKFPNIIHALGHGIGIEVHEAPAISPHSLDLIKNNMVFSIEPGIYLEGYGGIRIEDLVLVNNGKPELISKAKREIIEIYD